MTEKLLQFIWQHRLFDQAGLCVHTGDPLVILHPGQLNRHQGPDFSEARIRIGDTLWIGHVELHIGSSGWFRHGHHNDPHYRNVILHVVWDHDQAAESHLPLLLLQPRVPKWLLDKYQGWMEKGEALPCSPHLQQVSGLLWSKWMESLMVERLIHKTQWIAQWLGENEQNWEETCWWLLARNFGLKVNAGAFEQIARSLPLKLLFRERQVPLRIEALLLGQGGLLNESFHEDYPQMLAREYQYLQKKYELKPVAEPLMQLRMRPDNFPAVRLAQLAGLVITLPGFFTRLITCLDLHRLYAEFDITANDYWHYHYRFDEISGYKPKHLGKTMINSLLINTIVPILFAYGRIMNKPPLMQRAMEWLTQVRAEENSTTRIFSGCGKPGGHAGHTQAQLELYEHYCRQRRCLECAAGNAILRNGND